LTFIGAVVELVSGGKAWPVFAWACAQAAFAFICLVLGLLGEQVRLILNMTRKTPLVIERERVNFP
jgi:hypothetical protein